jgi:hypothetical protein
MLTPYQIVSQLYERYPQPRSFGEDQLANILNGCLFSRKDIFIMGRPVVRDADGITDPWVRFDAPDTWFIQAAAVAPGVGLVKTFLTLAPFSLRWVTFARRDGPLRYYEFEKLCARLTRS